MDKKDTRAGRGRITPARPGPARGGTGRATAALRRRLGDAVTTEAGARFAASFDSAKLSFLPAAVVRPRGEDDVAAVLELANRHGVPVTARGGGTATTGAASPVAGGWVLDLSGWRRLKIDATAGLAYAQPGVVVADLQAAARARGWFYPPDPSSLRYATVGGTIATNAGGMSGAKYGVTRDYVTALEGFLPTGEWVRWGMNLKKFASGYNVRDLWVGSEGTLGVVTGAVLRLRPWPAARRTVLAAFGGEAGALRAAHALLRRRLVPAVLEFLDRQSVECAERFTGRPVFAPPAGKRRRRPALLLVEVDGHPAEVAEAAAEVKAVLEPRAHCYREAAGAEEAEALWEVRRQCSPAMFQMGDTKLNEDVVVPMEAQVELLRTTLELRRETGLATPTFGHAADGNFHVHIMFDREREDQAGRAEEAVGRLMEKVVALGGAITGEHGIGLAKSPFLRLQHSPAEVAAMAAIKGALDPNGILNPGKIFEPFRVWEHAPVKVQLPWERRK